MAIQLRNKVGQSAGKFIEFIDEYEDDARIRFGKMKSAHRGITLEITSSRKHFNGGFEKHKCDLGHFHVEPVKEVFNWHKVTFDQADIKKLRDFLNDERWMKL